MTEPEVRVIARNRKALFNYQVDDEVEAGIVLRGTEVKSLRDGRVQMGDAYATVDRGEVFLHQLNISEYANGGYAHHDPMGARKLLLHRKEIDKLQRKVEEKGYTLIPIELYFKGARAKVKLGLCRGKKQYDKRESVKERDVERELRRRDK